MPLSARLRRAPGWLVVGGLVLVSAALRAWAGHGVPTPWITPDEPLYGLLGQGLYRDGTLSILGGPTPYYSFVVPALEGLPLAFGDLALGYSLLKALQALVISLAAVPVYLWGRTLMARGWAFLAAALTLALPGLAYAGLLMTEVAFYPVLALAAWTIAATLVSPTPLRQVLLLAALVLAAATRIQAIVLAPIFVTALLLEPLLGRTRPRWRRFAIALGGIGALAVLWVVVRLGSGSSLLAGYRDAG